MHHSRLLSDHQRARLPPPRFTKMGGCPKSKSGPFDSGQFAAWGLPQAVLKASFSVNCLDHSNSPVLSCIASRVARIARRIGIVVSGGNVQHAQLLINGRTGPHAGARRPELLSSRWILVRGLRGLKNSEALPNLLARAGIKRHHAPAKSAAAILRIRSHYFFERAEWLVNHSLVVSRRRGGHGSK